MIYHFLINLVLFKSNLKLINIYMNFYIEINNIKKMSKDIINNNDISIKERDILKEWIEMDNNNLLMTEIDEYMIKCLKLIERNNKYRRQYCSIMWYFIEILSQYHTIVENNINFNDIYLKNTSECKGVHVNEL